jgi:hypothetical protein
MNDGTTTRNVKENRAGQCILSQSVMVTWTCNVRGYLSRNSDTLRDGLSRARTHPGMGEIFRTRPDQSGSSTYPVKRAASLLLGFKAAGA